MKKTFFRTAAVLVIALGAVTYTAACSQWDTSYKILDEEGYTVSVRYDINGGVFAGTKDVYVVNVYNLNDVETNDDGMKEIMLTAPDDEALKKEERFEVSRPNFFFAGWYRERTPRTNEKGEMLDAYGEIITDPSTQEPGYIYSGKWDFDNDRLTVDPNGDYSSEENRLTLYAAWIPNFKYEFYVLNADGTVEETPYATHDGTQITVPTWKENEAKLSMGSFPSIKNMTLEQVYLSPDATTPLTGTFNAMEEYVNTETGTALETTIKVYTTWKEGDWYKIYTAEQLADTATPEGNYEIMADLDFAQTTWPLTFAQNQFKGAIIGNNKTISNITVLQGDIGQQQYGIFGAISEGASMTDLTFDNVTVTIQAGSRKQGASFGTLTGSLAGGATMENITINGTLNLSNEGYQLSACNIGLVCGLGQTNGITWNILCRLVDNDLSPVNSENAKWTYEINDTDGKIAFTE